MLKLPEQRTYIGAQRNSRLNYGRDPKDSWGIGKDRPTIAKEWAMMLSVQDESIAIVLVWFSV